ncbi:hypothetical protein FO519_003823 [Halicephalobus sp. NKZ332]|nr:hypothetical protein FO519_003823 [Halicephalobus sp. NKZ332]
MLHIFIFVFLFGKVFSCSPNGFGSPVGSMTVGPPGNPGIPGLPGLIAMPTPNVTNRDRRDVEKIPLDQNSLMHIVFDSNDVLAAKKHLNKIGEDMTQMFFDDPEMLSFTKFNFIENPVIVFANDELKSIFQLPKMSIVECLALKKHLHEISNPGIRSLDVVCN